MASPASPEAEKRVRVDDWELRHNPDATSIAEDLQATEAICQHLSDELTKREDEISAANRFLLESVCRQDDPKVHALKERVYVKGMHLTFALEDKDALVLFELARARIAEMVGRQDRVLREVEDTEVQLRTASEDLKRKARDEAALTARITEAERELAAIGFQQDERHELQTRADAQQRQIAGLRLRYEKLLAQAQQRTPPETPTLSGRGSRALSDTESQHSFLALSAVEIDEQEPGVAATCRMQARRCFWRLRQSCDWLASRVRSG
jgi:hypothetical protein